MHLWYKRRLNILFLGVWVLLITGLSLMPGSTVPTVSLFEGVDKLVHAVLYAVLVALAYTAFRRLITVTAVSIGYGVVVECLQAISSVYYGTGRSFELADIAANSCGAFLAACIVYYFFYT